jgi:hypothetical protein
MINPNQTYQENIEDMTTGSIDAPLSGRGFFRNADRIQPNWSSLNLDGDMGTLSKSKGVVNRLQKFLDSDP